MSVGVRRHAEDALKRLIEGSSKQGNVVFGLTVKTLRARHTNLE